jgi:NTE family protein
MEKFSVVLAGGGSKGIYQIGAWKGLQELGISFDAVAGTSIGAINGALMAQGDLKKARAMWRNLRLDQCVNLPAKTDKTSDNLLDWQHAGVIFREMIAHGGIDQSPMVALLSSYIDPARVFDSRVDFGLCTYNLKNRSSLKIWKQDIPRERLFSYLLASSALPLLRQVKVGEDVFLDGGIGDNLPFDMLRKKGFRNIIALDIRGLRNRTLETERLRISHICNSQDLGGLLDLTPERLERNYQFGILDAKKTFGKYDGIHYYFPVKDYQHLINYHKDGVVSGFEEAALMYEMPRDRVYTAEEFLDSLRSCKSMAAEKYAAARQRLNDDGIVSALRNGSLKSIKNMPSSVRLALLMELIAETKKNGSNWSIPLRPFRDMDKAAEALLHLDL